MTASLFLMSVAEVGEMLCLVHNAEVPVVHKASKRT